MKNSNNTSSSQMNISRRRLIATFGGLCAGLLSHETLATGLVKYSRKAAGPVRRGKILGESQMRILRALVEIIIPATETADAGTVDTHGFIDDQLSSCESPRDAREFIQSLDSVSELVKATYGKAYWELDEDSKIAVMTNLANGSGPFDEKATAFFKKLKGMTVIGYYTSEVGGAQELVYLPIPGGYDGDFKVSDNNGKAFAPTYY